MRTFMKAKFTLVEVVVALAIFGMGIAVALQMSANASMRAMKAVERWRSQHMMAQAAEYFLLNGPTGQMNSDFFPYSGASARCTVSEPEGLPDGMESRNGAWRLVALEISVDPGGGRKTESMKIEKILQDSDL